MIKPLQSQLEYAKTRLDIERLRIRSARAEAEAWIKEITLIRLQIKALAEAEVEAVVEAEEAR